MSAVTEISAAESTPVVARSPRVKMWRPLVVVAAAAAVLLIAATVFLSSGPKGNGGMRISGFSVLAQACAAEDALFAGDGVVHIVNEIVVKPVSDPDWARMRWLPVVSLEATGKPRFHQLTLAAEVGKGYTVEDQCWYDPATSRFVRLLTVDEQPIYANSYDGENIYWLEAATDDGSRIVNRPITKDFQPPRSPAELLGIAAGLRSGLDEKDKSIVLDAEEVTLENGSKGRVVKVGLRGDASMEQPDACYLVTIRTDDNTIARMEFVAKGESLFVLRRVKTETVRSPKVGWDLATIESQTAQPEHKPKAGIVSGMVVPNVSVQQMVEKADFKTYVFAADPSWAGKRQITDILDVASPPHRMFAIAYRAEDGRHVVLVQSPSYNKMLGPMARKMGKVVYESPNGVKVLSGPRDKWLAGILLQSARATISDPPSEDRTGYLLETSAGTFPALAINGQVTEEELHALIDSLVPAKPE